MTINGWVYGSSSTAVDSGLFFPRDFHWPWQRTPAHAPGSRKKRDTSINPLADSPLKIVIRIIKKKGSKILSLL